MFNQIKRNLYNLNLFIKSNYLYYILSMLVLFLFLAIVGIFFNIYMSTITQEQYIEEINNGQQFYAVKDSLYDPDQFYDYRHKKGNIDSIANFYNSLTTSSKFTYLSAFTQAVPIENFRGDSTFYYNSDAFLEAHPSVTANIKSMQMNHDTFDFYKIKLSHGEKFAWNEIDYKSNDLPVLLGSNYNGIYEIGDSFIGKYYFKEFNMIVKGFLAPNTFINYKGETEFYLDRYVILPYPVLCESANLSDSADFEFKGILYFAMINGKLASSFTKEDIIYEIKRIADETNFMEFSIIGLPELSSKYKELLSVINENQILLNTSILLLLILVVIIQHGIAQMILLKREAIYKNYWMIGHSPYTRIYMRDVSIPYIGAYILVNILLTIYFNKFSYLSLIFTSFTTLSILMIIYVTCSKLFMRKMSNLM